MGIARGVGLHPNLGFGVTVMVQWVVRDEMQLEGREFQSVKDFFDPWGRGSQER